MKKRQTIEKLSLVELETIKRNLRKTVQERLNTLIESVKIAEEMNLLPEREGRKNREERVNCSIREKLSRF
jgi:hypothetical protein